MKRLIINSGIFTTSARFLKFAAMVSLCLILTVVPVTNLQAQRHGGGGHRNPSWHYSGRHAHGAYFHRLPRGSSRIYYGGRNFHFRDGIYYHPYRSGFRVGFPPIGLRIGMLPHGYLSFYLGGLPYYYYYGTYYVPRDGGYEVVAPPVGAVVESLPRGYEKVMVNGHTYYIVDGVQYKPVLRDGEIWYQVIKSPERSSENQPDNERR